jgi:hypothetical protein
LTTNPDRNRPVEWEVSFQVDERVYVSDKNLLLDHDYVRIDPLPVKGETPTEKIREILCRTPHHRFGLEKIKLAYPGGDYSGPDGLIIERRHIKFLRRTAFRNRLQFGFCGHAEVLLYDGDMVVGAVQTLGKLPVALVEKLFKDHFDPDPDELEAEILRGEGDLPERAEKGCLWARMVLCEHYSRPHVKRWRALKALEWYRDAAEKGLPSAQQRMGIYYSPDGGRSIVKADGKKMVDWYLKAAKGGDSFSLTLLAFAFERGADGEVNLMKACALFDLMVFRGDKCAVKNRNRCMQQLTKKEIEMADKLSREYADQFPAKPTITARDLCKCQSDECPPEWSCGTMF